MYGLIESENRPNSYMFEFCDSYENDIFYKNNFYNKLCTRANSFFQLEGIFRNYFFILIRNKVNFIKKEEGSSYNYKRNIFI